MQNIEVYIVASAIGALFLFLSYYYWNRNGQPINRENELLRRIFVLEQEVDRLSTCLEELDTLRNEVNFLREENHKLVVALSRYLSRVDDPVAKREATADLERQLGERKRNLTALENRIATYPAGQAPVDIQTQHDREKEAIKNLESRIDLLRS